MIIAIDYKVFLEVLLFHCGPENTLFHSIVACRYVRFLDAGLYKTHFYSIDNHIYFFNNLSSGTVVHLKAHTSENNCPQG